MKFVIQILSSLRGGYMTVFILGNCVVFVWDFPLINYQLPLHKKKANNNNIFEWLQRP